jgi:thiamine pyrophosphate-dependent acetolactate synthase large subunit-like protein
MLLVLDRACFHRLQQQAQEGQQLAAAAVQAVLAAACRPILRVGGRARTAEEVDTLAELLSGLEVSSAGAAGQLNQCRTDSNSFMMHSAM